MSRLDLPTKTESSSPAQTDYMLGKRKVHVMKLLERVRDVGVRRRLAESTIDCYQSWILDFLRFCRQGGRWRTPGEIGAVDVEPLLTDLARRRRLSASSQNQALCAIVFLYKRVLGDELAEDHLGRFAFERSTRRSRARLD
jgi:site-specific recombinase XerD